MRQVNIIYDATMAPFRGVGDITAALQNGRAEIDVAGAAVVPQNTAASSPPSIFAKAANFATSAAKHVAAGMPQCTQEQIDARFAICQGCEFFDGRACMKCGCPVVREKAFVSKLSWANEKCPVGKWGPINPDSPP